MTTPKLQMPELVVGQAGKELTHNQALAVLDQLAQAVVVDKDLTAPPGSPANGEMYIVAAGATGAWAGQSGKLAYWLTTVAAWTFITPADGWSVWVSDEALRYERRSGAWSISQGRELLFSSRSYYVRADGSDSNSGLVDTAGGAFLTIQKAVDTAASIDTGIYDITIQIADGTYSGSVVLKSSAGSGQIRVIGNEATPANVIITGPGIMISGTDFGKYLLAGATLASTGTVNARASGRSTLQYRNIILQGSATMGTHLDANNYAIIQAVGPATINGSSQIGFSGVRYGTVTLSGQAITFSAGTALTARGFQASDQGRIDMFNVTFTGTFTGKRYEANGLAAIFTNGAGATYIPGSVAGTTSNSGIYY